jgi:hypothetical protein
MNKHWIAAATVLAAVGFASAANAAPKTGDPVSVTACAYPGVTGLCLMLKGPDGSVYNITGANPRPPLDVAVILRGTVTDKLSVCGQGRVLDNISWTATKRKCPR